jgi:polyisoprenoid-binding protein YceI
MTIRQIAGAIAVAGALFAYIPAGYARNGAPAALAIDRAQSRVTFTVTKWGFLDVEGRFDQFDGTIVYDAQRPGASRIDWRVKVASVDTDEPNRDQSLQQAEYFDAARYPELTFVSDRVSVAGPGELDVQGRITIRGRTKPITVRVTHSSQPDARGVPVRRFETQFTVNRYDFGVVGGRVLGPVISRDVRIKLVIVGRDGSGNPSALRLRRDLNPAAIAAERLDPDDDRVGGRLPPAIGPLDGDDRAFHQILERQVGDF